MKLKYSLYFAGLCLALTQPCLAQYKDQGIWNDFHKANLGKIVFSEKKIIHNSPDPALVKTSFDLTKPIKCRLYFAKSVANTCLEAEKSGKFKKGNFEYKAGDLVRVKGVFKVDGVEQKHGILDLLQDQTKIQEWTTWWYSLLPEDHKGFNSFSENTPEYAMGKIINDLSPGKHKIVLTFYVMALDQHSDEKVEISKGEFTLEFTDMNKMAWESKQLFEGDSNSSSEMKDAESDLLEDYVTFKNNCAYKIDIEYTSLGSTYSNTFINSSSQQDIKMRTGDQLRTKEGTVLYTHKATGSSKTVYLCN